MSNTVNILGQAVNADHLDQLAIGMYFLDGDAIPSNLNCGELAPIAVVAHHGIDEDGEPTGVLYGCAGGHTITEHLPDMYLVDDSWKQWPKYVMLFAIFLLLAAIIKRAV
ncbi:MAG: hypothetical protein GY881_02910 [Gammaproteobacteria bacterium]|nr:hypothetical protein [Gammaproteobacteria bacterium]